MTTEKTYTVYASRVAGELRRKGFKIVKKGTNSRYPEYDTFLFYDTPEFRKALVEVTTKSK